MCGERVGILRRNRSEQNRCQRILADKAGHRRVNEKVGRRIGIVPAWTAQLTILLVV